MITKESLLHELIHHTYVMLRPSPIEGIGVFAIQPIKKGCRNMFSKPDPNDRWINLSKKDVSDLPGHAQRLIENYCLYDDHHYFVPEKSFKMVDLTLFLNHSESPNIISIEEGNYFEALRDIAEGEELQIDYGTIVD